MHTLIIAAGRRALGAACALALCLVMGPSLLWAQAPEPPPKGDPYGQSETWLQPSPVEQAARDETLAAAGTGAIFVPSMTDPDQEPEFVVMQNGDELARAEVGTKVYVVPGKYDVLVGSGDPQNMLEFEVNVVEGRITYVPALWAGITITVIDERGAPFRGSYELVTLPEREYVGLGFGALINQGETPTTWLLRPGTYMMLAANESYQARQNFVTFRLAPGQHIQYTVVLDQTTGDLLGAGEVQILPSSAEGWDFNLQLGGSVEFNSATNVVGKSDGQILALNGFFETTAGYLDERNIGYGRLNAEVGGRIRYPAEDSNGQELGFLESRRPFFATVNELNLELLYAYRVLPWFGPYGRLGARTQIVPGYQEFDIETEYALNRLDGSVETGTDLDVLLTDAFAPINIEAGTGALVVLDAGYWFKMQARVGLGFRQFISLGTLVADDDPGTAVFEFSEVDNVTQFGIENNLTADINISRWATIRAAMALLAPFDYNGDNDGTFDPLVLDFRGGLILRLTSIFSINYTIRVIEDPQVVDKTQLDQSILLRFAYRLF